MTRGPAAVVASVVALGLCMATGTSSSQTIHRADIARFVGTLSVTVEQAEADQVERLTKPRFESFGMQPRYPVKEPRLQMKDGSRTVSRKEYEVAIPTWKYPSECHRELEPWGVALTILSEPLGGAPSVIAFWSIDGDSLRFRALADTTFGGQLWSATFGNWAPFADGSLVIVLAHQGGDAEDRWGRFDFLHFIPGTLTLTSVYAESYSINYLGDYIEVQCSLDSETLGRPRARVVRSSFRAVPKPRWEPDHRLTGRDTTYIDLW